MSIHGRNIMILQFTMNNTINMVQQIHICYIKQKSWKHWCYCYWKRKQSDYVNQHICICYFTSNKRWNNNFGCNWSSKVVFVSNETKYFEDDKDTTGSSYQIDACFITLNYGHDVVFFLLCVASSSLLLWKYWN